MEGEPKQYTPKEITQMEKSREDEVRKAKDWADGVNKSLHRSSSDILKESTVDGLKLQADIEDGIRGIKNIHKQMIEEDIVWGQYEGEKMNKDFDNKK